MKDKPLFSVMTRGIRTNAYTDESKIVDICLTVYEKREDGEQWVWITDGGVTGYESFELGRFQGEHGWMACFGTERRWDKLEIPKDSMEIAMRRIKRSLRNSSNYIHPEPDIQ